MADVKKEYEDYEVVFFRRTEKEDEEEAKQESLESYQYRLQSKRHRNMMESLSFKNLSREEDEDEDEETNPSPSKSAKTLAPTSPLNNLPSFENMECLPVVVPYFRRIEIIGSKEEPTGTREIPDLWFPASAIDEKDLNRFSSYAQTVIKRYNKVKKTDFEFVRLVKMRWTLGHVYLRFKAKSSGAGPGATLKTFEGDVRCNLCLVNEEDGRPLSCRLIGRNFDDYLYAYPPPDGNILTNIVNALIAVPHFYTQVLHLINKMNIPAPFRMALPTPPLPPLVPAPPPPPPPPPVSAKPHAADLFSDESEIMESSDVEIDVRAYSAGASAVKKSGRKCLRQEAIVGPAVDKDVAHEAIGVKPATLVPKRIPMIKKKNPVLQIKIALKVIQNEHRDESTAEELEEPDKEGSDIKSYANPEELESGKLPPEEILSLTMFKNYAAGNLASVLYIKNLAKDVTAEDFYFIFGSLFGNIDAAKSGLSIKLMQNYAAGNPASVLYIKNLAKDVTAKDFYFIFGSLFGSIDAAKSGLSIKLMQAWLEHIDWTLSLPKRMDLSMRHGSKIYTLTELHVPFNKYVI